MLSLHKWFFLEVYDDEWLLGAHVILQAYVPFEEEWSERFEPGAFEEWSIPIFSV